MSDYISKIDVHRIETIATAGRGYDRHNTARTSADLRDTEIGLQLALANMDTIDGSLDVCSLRDFRYQTEALVRKLNEACIPLSAITDGNGFARAFDAAYAKPYDELAVQEVLNDFERFISGEMDIDFDESSLALDVTAVKTLKPAALKRYH